MLDFGHVKKHAVGTHDASDPPRYVFNHPIDFHYIADSVASWPQLHLQVFKLDAAGRVEQLGSKAPQNQVRVQGMKSRWLCTESFSSIFWGNESAPLFASDLLARTGALPNLPNSNQT